MTAEHLTEWAQSWDKPIGTLIERFVDFDRDFVAVLQAQLLTIHRAGTGENLFKSAHDSTADAKNTDLFALLRTGASGIGLKLQELAINHNNVSLARADVDKGKGMPRKVPPFGLIAKSIGFVTIEICDQLLVAQAAARMLLNSRLNLENVPSLNDALNSNLFAHIGKNDKEPQELQIAQSYAHLALIHQALIKEAPIYSGARYDAAYRQMAYASIAHGILEKAHETLAILGVSGAAESIDSVLSDFVLPPEEHNPVSVINSQITWLHHDLIAGNIDDPQRQHEASIIESRMRIISGIQGNGTAPGAPKHTL